MRRFELRGTLAHARFEADVRFAQHPLGGALLVEGGDLMGASLDQVSIEDAGVGHGKHDAADDGPAPGHPYGVARCDAKRRLDAFTDLSRYLTKDKSLVIV
jgi:hypothetical protein